MCKKPCFRGPLVRQHGKLVNTLLQSERQHLYNIYKSLWRFLHWKNSLLVIHILLRLFVNILTVNDKHYLLNRDNLPQPIQVQLSQKQENFSEFLFAFLKSVLNFKYLTPTADPRNWSLFGNTGSEKYAYINV